MCGIAGFFNQQLSEQDRKSKIFKMISSIEHRGPDAQSYSVIGPMVIANTRLEVIDLKGGEQPFFDNSLGLSMVYNGEVYNYKELRETLNGKGHKFTTSSDSEVVFRSFIEWREECFSKFNGGFAVCFYDSKNKEVTLARDFFGKKPLYYSNSNKIFSFASEVKALFCLDPRLMDWDTESLKEASLMWTESPDRSVYKNINQVPPGALIKFSSGKVSTKVYQNWYHREESNFTNQNEAVEEIHSLLDQSVKMRLRSDVPIGIYLSGGLDSSVLSHFVNKNYNSDVMSFSINFTDANYDEKKYQELIVKKYGFDHNSIEFSQSKILDLLPEALWYSEKPSFRTAFVPMLLLSKLTKQNNIKVVLSGEGADEQFLGYNIFRESLLRSNWNQLEESDKNNSIRELYHYLEHFNDHNISLTKALFDRFSRDNESLMFSHSLRINSNQKISRLILSNENKSHYIEENQDLLNNLDILRKTQFIENNTLLNGYLLSTQGDRMSFANGVEQRCPFLDINLFKKLWSYSSNTIYGGKYTTEKPLLKLLAKQITPHEIVDRPKTPYRSPDIEIIKSQKYLSMTEDLLNSKSSEKLDHILNKRFAKGFLNKLKTQPQSCGPSDAHTGVFLLSLLILSNTFSARIDEVQETNNAKEVIV